MDADHLQAIALRDQFWASLRLLMPEIQRLAEGNFDGSDREKQVLQLLARCVAAELAFREADSQGQPPAGPEK
ncbi:MAG TPA: hypothetical protein VG013_16320 [Gemmataceae bacterium]|jgi:hypothetical protein|nr:hypothetical protein [Gemmataceae bacterium]